MGVGIDLVDIVRAEGMLEAHRRRVLERLLTDAERQYVIGMKHPARHLAVRLAAKEAVYKALQSLPGAREVGWREIEVIRGGDGRPSIRLHGLAEQLLEQHGRPRILVSLTHSELSAAAVAILLGEWGNGGR